jgi:type II secretory pathway pseudopilin PulG
LVIGMIAILLGIVLIGARYARRLAIESADRTTVASLKTAVSAFRQNFGFLPPLVKESPDGTTVTPLTKTNPPQSAVVFALDAKDLSAQDQDALRGEFEAFPPKVGDATKPRRYSNATITYYLLGVLGRVDPSPTATALDGVEGPGFREPNRDGTFKKTGRTFEPLFDFSRNPKALRTIDASLGQFSLTDARGLPYRYYRWLENATPKYVNEPLRELNVPFVVGDPQVRPELRGVKHAIVAAGPNAVFGDEPESDLREALGDQTADLATLQAQARADNVVEVLR